MKSVMLLLVHLIVSLAKLAGPGGPRSLVAETLLLKPLDGKLRIGESAANHCQVGLFVN